MMSSMILWMRVKKNMVLIDNYNTLEFEANKIEGWKSANKNELCNKYIEYEKSDPELAQCYFCAIVCRYWPMISKYYYQHKDVFSLEDCYDWLLHSITYAFEHRKWLDPTSKIYNDPAGPDKIINRAMFSTCLTEYQHVNKEKRKSNLFSASLDSFKEEYGDAFYNMLGDEYIDYLSVNTPYGYLVVDAFETKQFVLAFLLDAILEQDVFKLIEQGNSKYCVFDDKKLVKYLRRLDEKSASIFAKRYDIEFDRVADSIHYITDLSTAQLRRRIKNNLVILKKKLKRESLLD